jgi:hypothetical protein
MKGYCVCCGSPVPGDQNTCSMCYGDIDHGTDGYYRRWVEEETDRQHQREEERPPEDEHVQEDG